MSRDSAFVEEQAALYAATHSLQPTEVQRELIAETASLGRVAGMQIGPLPIGDGLTMISPKR